MKWALFRRKRIRIGDVVVADLILLEASGMAGDIRRRKNVPVLKALVWLGSENLADVIVNRILWVNVLGYYDYERKAWFYLLKNPKVIDVEKSPDVKRLLLLEDI
jgi:hypothetical protein